MTCFACGELITNPEQFKPFGRCDACLEAIEQYEAVTSIADYWTLLPKVQQWIRVAVLVEEEEVDV